MILGGEVAFTVFIFTVPGAGNGELGLFISKEAWAGTFECENWIWGWLLLDNLWIEISAGLFPRGPGIEFWIL